MPHYRAPRRRHSLIESAARALLFGSRRYCAVCGSTVRAFRPYGHARRQEAQCPVCGSVERHRLIWEFFERQSDLFDERPKRLLHVAPEPALERRLRGLPSIEYVSADAQDGQADLRIDLTDTELPSESYDVILCSHVLEHIQEDRKAMREMARLLKPNGWACILVPLSAPQTFDDPSVTDPAERTRLFGQWDHVRAYGPDIAERLTGEGFDVQTLAAEDIVADAEERERTQVKEEHLYYCRKRTA